MSKGVFFCLNFRFMWRFVWRIYQDREKADVIALFNIIIYCNTDEDFFGFGLVVLVIVVVVMGCGSVDKILHLLKSAIRHELLSRVCGGFVERRWA
jgi:hypothetical protein